MGFNLNFSINFHPQSYRQTKRVNALLELYLRHYMSANQKDWTKLLDVVFLTTRKGVSSRAGVHLRLSGATTLNTELTCHMLQGIKSTHLKVR